MMNPLIIKLGGVLLDSEEALERLFTALVNYRESHQRPLVIVHGGGCVVDELMNCLLYTSGRWRQRKRDPTR